MKDIRKINLNKKAQGFERIAVLIVVVVIVLLVILLLYSKFSASIETSILNGGIAVNTSGYCPVATNWNGSYCLVAGVDTALTPYPAEFTTLTTTQTNALASFDLTSIGPIVLAGVGILAAVSLFNR